MKDTSDNMKLITSKTCPPCKLIKEYIEENCIGGVHILDIDTAVGMDLAVKHSVRSVPTLVDGEDVISGLDEIKERLKP